MLDSLLLGASVDRHDALTCLHDMLHDHVIRAAGFLMGANSDSRIDPHVASGS